MCLVLQFILYYKSLMLDWKITFRLNTSLVCLAVCHYILILPIYSRDSFLRRHRGPEGLRQERGGVEIREAVSGTGRDGRELLMVRISEKKFT